MSGEDHSSQGGEPCNRFESIMNNDDGENNIIQSELIEREHDSRDEDSRKGSSKKKRSISQRPGPSNELMISQLEGQEEEYYSEEECKGQSHISQMAMDFFLHTNGADKGPGILQNSNEKSPNEKSTVVRSGMKETELFGDIEYSPQAQRAHTDNDISVNSGLDLLPHEQNKVIQKSPKMRKLFIQFSERKVLEIRKRKGEKDPSTQKNNSSKKKLPDEEYMCYQMITDTNIIEKPLETDVPNLDNRVTR
mmetsp:Transcript_282/g.299  ORF Transcript_282/g.299 Transcript_282/m.299 type:complete len:250 (+) Transcript_282:619-1368(+)